MGLSAQVQFVRAHPDGRRHPFPQRVGSNGHFAVRGDETACADILDMLFPIDSSPFWGVL